MYDKILGFIRETLLHENLVDHLAIDLVAGEIQLNLLQPDRDGVNRYPDPELLLTFSGLRDLAIQLEGTSEMRGNTVFGIDCIAVDGFHRAVIAVGDTPGRPAATVRLTFAGLRYKRS